MKASSWALRSDFDLKMPRLRSRRVRIEKNSSIWLSQEAWVGVKWKVQRGWAASQALTSAVLWTWRLSRIACTSLPAGISSSRRLAGLRGQLLANRLLGLDRGLLVERDDERVLGRAQVQAADIGLLGVEFGVERGKPGAHLVGLEVGLGEDRVRLRLADSHPLGERAHRPVGLALRRRRAGCLEHLDAAVVVVGGRRAGTGQISKALKPPLGKAPPPLPHLLLGEPDHGSDLAVGLALRRQQHHPRPGHHPLLARRRAHDLLERRALLIR